MQHIQMSTMGHQEDSDVELELSSDDDGECTLCTPNAQHPIANRPSSSAAPPTLFQQHSQSMHPDYEVPAGFMTETEVYQQFLQQGIRTDRYGFVEQQQLMQHGQPSLPTQPSQQQSTLQLHRSLPSTPRASSTSSLLGRFSSRPQSMHQPSNATSSPGPSGLANLVSSATTAATGTTPIKSNASSGFLGAGARDARAHQRRLRKWLQMLGPQGEHLGQYMATHPAKFKERVRKGIPEELRGLSWQLLSGGRLLQAANPGVYLALQEHVEVDTDSAIMRDLNRTFPHHVFFMYRQGPGQKALYNVLRAYAAYDHKVGYVQGMGFIAAVLLLHMGEEESFWTLVALMKGPPLQQQEELERRAERFGSDAPITPSAAIRAHTQQQQQQAPFFPNWARSSGSAPPTPAAGAPHNAPLAPSQQQQQQQHRRHQNKPFSHSNGHHTAPPTPTAFSDLASQQQLQQQLQQQQQQQQQPPQLHQTGHPHTTAAPHNMAVDPSATALPSSTEHKQPSLKPLQTQPSKSSSLPPPESSQPPTTHTPAACSPSTAQPDPVPSAAISDATPHSMPHSQRRSHPALQHQPAVLPATGAQAAHATNVRARSSSGPIPSIKNPTACARCACCGRALPAAPAHLPPLAPQSSPVSATPAHQPPLNSSGAFANAAGAAGSSHTSACTTSTAAAASASATMHGNRHPSTSSAASAPSAAAAAAAAAGNQAQQQTYWQPNFHFQHISSDFQSMPNLAAANTGAAGPAKAFNMTIDLRHTHSGSSFGLCRQSTSGSLSCNLDPLYASASQISDSLPSTPQPSAPCSLRSRSNSPSPGLPHPTHKLDSAKSQPFPSRYSPRKSPLRTHSGVGFEAASRVSSPAQEALPMTGNDDTNGLPNNDDTNGYPDNDNTNGLPNNDNTNGYPDNDGTNGYPATKQHTPGSTATGTAAAPAGATAAGTTAATAVGEAAAAAGATAVGVAAAPADATAAHEELGTGPVVDGTSPSGDSQLLQQQHSPQQQPSQQQHSQQQQPQQSLHHHHQQQQQHLQEPPMVSVFQGLVGLPFSKSGSDAAWLQQQQQQQQPSSPVQATMSGGGAERQSCMPAGLAGGSLQDVSMPARQLDPQVAQSCMPIAPNGGGVEQQSSTPAEPARAAPPSAPGMAAPSIVGGTAAPPSVPGMAATPFVAGTAASPSVPGMSAPSLAHMDQASQKPPSRPTRFSRESATVSGSDKGSTSHTPSRQPISPTPSPNSTSTAAAVSSQPATPAWTSKASPNPPSTATVASGQTITPACTPNRSPNGPPLGPPLDSKLGSSLLAHVSDSACKARSLALPDAAVTPLLCAECAREGGGEGAEQEGVGERTSGKGQAPRGVQHRNNGGHHSQSSSSRMSSSSSSSSSGNRQPRIYQLSLGDSKLVQTAGAMMSPGQRFALGSMYVAGMPLLQQSLFQLQGLIKDEVPRLAKLLAAEGLEVGMFSTCWFNTIFAYCLPFSHLLRIWDIFMLEGLKIVFRSGIVLLKAAEKRLTRTGSIDGMVELLGAKNIHTLLPPPSSMIKMALKIKVSKRLADLQQQWEEKQKSER